MKIYVDIDDTICYYDNKDIKKKMEYDKAKPYLERIKKINDLFDNGHKIIYWTARGTVTQKLWFNITYEQLKYSRHIREYMERIKQHNVNENKRMVEKINIMLHCPRRTDSYFKYGMLTF